MFNISYTVFIDNSLSLLLFNYSLSLSTPSYLNNWYLEINKNIKRWR